MSFWDVIGEVGSYGNRYGPNYQASPTVVDGDSTRLHARTDKTEDRIDHLLLVVEAMWEILGGRFGVSMDELMAKVREIDGRNGIVDGHRARTQSRTTCTGCQAIVPAGMAKCQFCGAVAPTAGADPFAL